MSETCIYCPSSDFSEEHCLPLGLGKFRGHHILERTVCRSCNSRISMAEEQFLRASPEALFRHSLGIKGRKYHKPTSPYYRGSAGAPPLRIMLPHPEFGCNILWEIIPGTKTLRQLRQIVMRRENDETIPVAMPPEIDSSEKLSERLRDFGVEHAEPIFFSKGPSESIDDMFAILKGVWPNKEYKDIPNGDRKGKVRAEIVIRVTSLYFRAIAKIGFHYFLAVFPDQYTGAETEFRPIRSFILDGKGKPEDFVRDKREHIVFDVGHGLTTSVWGHFLTVNKREDIIQSKIQFFIGPESYPPIFEIMIGPNPAQFIYPESKGHFYAYFRNGPKDGYAGEVSEMKSVRTTLLP